ncbi:hypothetical protein HMPREF6745_0988 [Prevotella sp. oral taxon 472 str. F0295]|nr:hypothetical protein HMPREF6745_0988 [Prevotella sp. oral taxon 472 str. F0295]
MANAHKLINSSTCKLTYFQTEKRLTPGYKRACRVTTNKL